MFTSTVLVRRYVESKLIQIYGEGLNQNIVVLPTISSEHASWRLNPEFIDESKAYVFAMYFPVEYGVDPVLWIETGKRIKSKGLEWSPKHFSKEWSQPGLNANEIPRSSINCFKRLRKFLKNPKAS